MLLALMWLLAYGVFCYILQEPPSAFNLVIVAMLSTILSAALGTLREIRDACLWHHKP